MSTFEERQRARVNALLAETMDDVASEMRKAVTPPATSDEWKYARVYAAADAYAAEARTLTDLPGGYRPRDVMPVGVRQEFDHYIYVNFDSTEFRTWFEKWFAQQVRAHGGMRAMLGRLR